MGMPSEKHSQQYERQCEPNGQPDQRAAEDLFGAAPVTQGPQQEGKSRLTNRSDVLIVGYGGR